MHRHAIFGGRWTPVLAAVLLSGSVAACSSVTDTLLEAQDPDLIDPSALQSATGALAAAAGTMRRLEDATGGGAGTGSANTSITSQQESTWMFGGLLADEWSSSSTFVQNDETDQRSIQLNNTQVAGQLRNLYRVRTSANQALPLLKKFAPTQTGTIAEQYFARGYSELQLAQDFCNGIPLSDGTAVSPVNGAPQTTAQVFAVAAASFDSAITLATGTDAKSVAVARAARIGKARAQVALNQLDAAAATVAGIPTTFAYQATFATASSGDNQLWSQGLSSKRYSVGDSLEGNGRSQLVKNVVPFGSLNDPRVPVIDTKKPGQDGQTFTRTTNIWGRFSPVDIVNGIDARLIEAEAALKKGDPSWLTILNALRAAPPTISDQFTVKVLAPLTDPGTPDARLDLLFRERALWTFGRGERLSDLRRLVRQYGRSVQNTFPQGVHYKGGNYGADVNLPVGTDEKNNTLFTECLDRNA